MFLLCTVRLSARCAWFFCSFKQLSNGIYLLYRYINNKLVLKALNFGKPKF
jgi:hypothetical protein